MIVVLTREPVELTPTDVKMLSALRRGIAQRSIAVDLGVRHAYVVQRLKELRAAYRVDTTTALLDEPAVQAALPRGSGRPPRASIEACTPVTRGEATRQFSDIELIILTSLCAGTSQQAVNDQHGWPRHTTWYTLKQLRKRFRVDTTSQLLVLPIVRDAVKNAGGK